jgi:hypothetical protein
VISAYYVCVRVRLWLRLRVRKRVCVRERVCELKRRLTGVAQR